MTRVAIGDIHLNVEVSGHGPALLLLHGFTGSAATWTPHAPAWDRVTEFASEGLGSLPSWIAGLEHSGAGICAVRTRRHETKLGNPA